MNMTVISRRHWLTTAAILAAGSRCFGQTVVPETDSPFASRWGESATQRWQFGLKLRTRSAVREVTATFPVPQPYDEQTVAVVDQQIDRGMTALPRSATGDLAKQIVVTAPALPASGQFDVLMTLDVTRRHTLAPIETDGLVIPERAPRSMRLFLGRSPNIDTGHSSIKRLHRELAESETDGESAWSIVRTIYETVRGKVGYVEGPIRKASDALRTGQGDCEDMTSLFVALCRLRRIPARMVWIPGHCYPEFCLFDPDGEPHWYPCQVAGSEAFGEMPEHRPILQKGDRFKVPESRGPVRYLAEHFQCVPRGKKAPRPTFVMQRIDDASSS